MSEEPIQFNDLAGRGFTEPLYELRPSRHPLFRILRSFGLSPQRLNRCKFRIRHILNTPRNPFKRYQCSVLLIRIPKNASSSLCDVLYGEDKHTAHFTAQFLQQINPRRFQKAIKVAVIRNPEDRFPSAILYNQFKSPHRHDQAFARRFLDRLTPEDLNQAMNEDTTLRKKIVDHTHFHRQVNYVCDSQGKVIADLLISMDSFEPGLQELSRVTGRTFRMIHSNASPKNKGQKAFKLTGAVRDFYEPDFKLWDLVNGSKEGFVWLTDPPEST